MLERVAPPLASAYLKLIRAQEHLDPLVVDIRRFENSQPYSIVRETDESAREHVAYAVLANPPGDAWYGPFGDAIHNLHAALDHAVFGLSEWFLGRRLTENEARDVAFPIYSDAAKWAGFVNGGSRAIRFLPIAYRQIIESEQPYRGGNDYIRTSHPMHVLHTLWNLDKHRKIGFFAGFGRVMTVYVPGNPGFSAYRVTPRVVDDGSEVVRIPIGSIEGKEDFEPIIQVEISLQEGRPPRNPVTRVGHPIGRFTMYMHNTVFQVLSSFQDLLDRGIR